MKKISIIVPAYNEEESLPFLYERLTKLIDCIENYEFEVLFINDGSRDRTLEVAMMAGLDYAKGDAVIFIDADLQDPPELIPELIKYWEEGYDDVYAKRKSREGETFFKKFTSKLYYQVLQKLSKVEIQKDTVLFDRDARVAGKTKWNYKKLVDLAIDGITSFTTSPLRLSTYISIPTFIILGVYFIYVIAKSCIIKEAIQAYQAIILLILFFSGIQILLFGIVGEYLGRIFNETKNRPLYLVDEYNGEKEKNEI